MTDSTLLLNPSHAVIEIEKDLLNEIVKNLRKHKLEPQKAQLLAQEFLSHLPPQDFNQLVEVLKNMSAKFPEAGTVYVKYYAIQERLSTQSKLQSMALHIQNGNIEKAIEVAREGRVVNG